MALGNDPSRNDIWDELYASQYRNGGTNENSLKKMNDYVGLSTPYERSNFGGLGRPEASIVGVNNITEKSAEVELSLDFTSGFGTNHHVEYDTDSAFDSSDIEYGGPQSSTGNVTVNLIELDDDTTYYVRGLVYNLFNNNATDDSNDYIKTDSISFTTGEAELQNLEYFSGILINDDEFDLDWDDPNGTEADNYELRWRERNTTTWQTSGQWDSTTNWGTSDENRSGVWDTGEFSMPGSEWEVEIRGLSTDGSRAPTDWIRTNIAEPI